MSWVSSIFIHCCNCSLDVNIPKVIVKALHNQPEESQQENNGAPY